MIKNQNFNKLVDLICEKAQHAHLRPVIEKELLHYDILFALSNSKLTDTITFQGGTSLRLCYGLKRFSEDLDFAGGTDFNFEMLKRMKYVIESYVGARYGLQVDVVEPKYQLAAESKAEVRVLKWKMSITTRPDRKDLPRQKIRIEVANVPAHTRKLKPIINNYTFLPDGYSQIFVYVESLDEILADKILAFAERKFIKYRDIWDLQWLTQKKANLQMQIIKHKIVDYKTKNFPNLLQNRLSTLDKEINSTAFYNEMSRFLDEDALEILQKEGFKDYVVDVIRDLGTQVLFALQG